MIEDMDNSLINCVDASCEKDHEALISQKYVKSAVLRCVLINDHFQYCLQEVGSDP